MNLLVWPDRILKRSGKHAGGFNQIHWQLKREQGKSIYVTNTIQKSLSFEPDSNSPSQKIPHL